MDGDEIDGLRLTGSRRMVGRHLYARWVWVDALVTFGPMAHGDACVAPGRPYRLNLRNETDGIQVDGLHVTIEIDGCN
jgi:hypothetical protein